MTDDNKPSRLLKTVSAMASLSVPVTIVSTLIIFVQAEASSTPALDATRYPALPNVQNPLRAPIGHVQPTPRDLSPSVLEKEAERTKGQIDFDKKLQICRPC